MVEKHGIEVNQYKFKNLCFCYRSSISLFFQNVNPANYEVPFLPYLLFAYGMKEPPKSIAFHNILVYWTMLKKKINREKNTKSVEDLVSKKEGFVLVRYCQRLPRVNKSQFYETPSLTF